MNDKQKDEVADLLNDYRAMAQRGIDRFNERVKDEGICRAIAWSAVEATQSGFALQVHTSALNVFNGGIEGVSIFSWAVNAKERFTRDLLCGPDTRNGFDSHRLVTDCELAVKSDLVDSLSGLLSQLITIGMRED